MTSVRSDDAGSSVCPMAFSRVDENGFVSFTCPNCGGPSHPSNGSQLGPGYVLCEPCARDFAKWVQSWTRGRRGRLSFYEAATKR